MPYQILKNWIRLETNRQPVYIYPNGPDWFVPNEAGESLLQGLKNNSHDPADVKGMRVLNEIRSQTAIIDYKGRSAHITLNGLEECWFHITDQCNLSCSHCLFNCSPKDTSKMMLNDFRDWFVQAFDLGARTFFLTGGEPLLHSDFQEICKDITDKSPDNHLVILTNGLLAEKHLDFFKSLPTDRLHFQVSIDGSQPHHDHLRGDGTYIRVLDAIEKLSGITGNITLAMSVGEENTGDMVSLVETANQFGIRRIHYLWMLAAGNAKKINNIPTEILAKHLKAAFKKAAPLGITIDNIEAIEQQIFSPQGTKYDLGNAGWESLAIKTDGTIYPTPALIGEADACCGNIDKGLDFILRTSATLTQIRSLSIVNDIIYNKNPLKYLIGGGDIDHSYFNSGHFSGHDPYVELYNNIALWRITDAVKSNGGPRHPAVLIKMGDRILNCDNAHGGVALTHSNCVLSVSDINTSVSGFYSEAAEATNNDIVNPVCYPEETISHIPDLSRIRSYGCGSPVMDADLKPGESLVDLGSGAGMECFIAAKALGRTGSVTGIDMTDSMLNLAEKSRQNVEKNLGYSIIAFKKAMLEKLPINADSTDIVISNCVINLSGDKHTTFAEIFRILKPGGRIVISDIVTDNVPIPEILNDPVLRGECIAGALTQNRLISILELKGFQNITFNKRFFYREVKGHLFYSVTYTAYKPTSEKTIRTVMYPGPFASVLTDSGDILLKGEIYELPLNDHEIESSPLFILDENGNAENIDAENACACYLPPESQPEVTSKEPAVISQMGCIKCGSPLQYLKEEKPLECAHCGQLKPANAICEAGHFICNTCHSSDANSIVSDICLNATEKDMIRLLNRIRKHPAVPLHGPEHHFAIPGAIVAAYRNLGGNVTDKDIISAIERGKTVPGGTCGFWGGCGAALGVGIAFGIILESNPIKAAQRQNVQKITGEIILKLSHVKASRCCQRESWTAMIIASELSEKYLPVFMPVDDKLSCSQISLNKECPGTACSFFRKPEGILLPFA